MGRRMVEGRDQDWPRGDRGAAGPSGRAEEEGWTNGQSEGGAEGRAAGWTKGSKGRSREGQMEEGIKDPLLITC